MISPVLFAVRGRPNSELWLTLVTQSPDVSDDYKIPSCFDLPVVPHKSVCLPIFFLLPSFFQHSVCVFVCFLFGRSRRAWQLSALFIWTGVICPPGPQMASAVFVV